MSAENVGGLVAKWRGLAETEVSRYSDPQNAHDATLKECADELEATLSAHGQPVVDEVWLRQAIEEFKYLSGRTDLPMQDRERWRALTAALGATP